MTPWGWEEDIVDLGETDQYLSICSGSASPAMMKHDFENNMLS